MVNITPWEKNDRVVIIFALNWNSNPFQFSDLLLVVGVLQNNRVFDNSTRH